MRWLTPTEILLFQGFPIPGCMKAHGEATSFDKCRDERSGMLPRSRRCMLEQAGNSMHVNVLGLALMWCLTYIVLEAPRSAWPSTGVGGAPSGSGGAEVGAAGGLLEEGRAKRPCRRN